jgi:hypothetical protein
MPFRLVYMEIYGADFLTPQTNTTLPIPHRGINVDHGINVDQFLKPRKKCKYSVLYLHLFRGFEC